MPLPTPTTDRRIRHGLYGSRTYWVWASMLQRCLNPLSQKYADYGGRGISVCKRWHKFEHFLADMGEQPAGLTLDRLKNHRGYSKTNCRWVTMSTQQNNKRNNRLLTVRGVTKTFAQWEDEFNLRRSLIRERFRRGWSEVEIIEEYLT